MKTVHCAGVLLIKTGMSYQQVALTTDVHRKCSGLGLPKGHVEQGETPKQTALRELREETGINLSCVTLLSSYPAYERVTTEQNGETVCKIIHMYLGCIDSLSLFDFPGNPELLRWVKPSLVPESLHFDEDRKFVSDALQFLIKEETVSK